VNHVSRRRVSGAWRAAARTCRFGAIATELQLRAGLAMVPAVSSRRYGSSSKFVQRGLGVKNAVSALAFAAALTVAGAAYADHDVTITIENHRFVPSEVEVPANQRITLTIVNKDATTEEFESRPLKVEKIVAGNGKITVRVGPLKPGRYPFEGEFHADTAKGVLIAKE
jgi:hypothetical protein